MSKAELETLHEGLDALPKSTLIEDGSGATALTDGVIAAMARTCRTRAKWRNNCKGTRAKQI